MNAEQNSKLSAFPFVETNETSCVSDGLSKREYFAGLAMQGLLANPNVKRPDNEDVCGHSYFASVCVLYADNLLKQLSE